VLSASWRRLDLSVLFWTAPLALYLALASISSLQLGVRLVLPALPFGLLIAGGAVRWLLDSGRAPVVILAPVWLFIQTARVYPNGISYFNEVAGGPSAGIRYLTDSNLDWGQGLPELERHMHARHIPSVRLAYFGNDIPGRFFSRQMIEGVPVPWSEGAVKERELQMRTGYYAISATLLTGQFFPPSQRDYFKSFRRLRPAAILAHSIYLYKVD
jgi:hypothetical protein